MGTFPNSLEIM